MTTVSHLRRAAQVVATALALSAAAPAAAAPPRAGLFLPGERLGGVALGATQQEVERRWGRDFGRCLCLEETWYFNEKKFEPEGVGVEFRDGRAVALFTLWSPAGWHTPQGLAVGDPASRITKLYGRLARIPCRGYVALTRTRGDTVTSFYVVGRKVWGFGLSRESARLCR